jgi:hypothetical protein
MSRIAAARNRNGAIPGVLCEIRTASVASLFIWYAVLLSAVWVGPLVWLFVWLVRRFLP